MRTKIIAGTTLTVLALGCCWAAIPRQTTAPLLEAYRQTGLALTCNHHPYCQTRDYHEQQLALDELCYDSPRHTRVVDCLKSHMDFVFRQGCKHAPQPCTDPLGHYNAIRREQGLKPIDVR